MQKRSLDTGNKVVYRNYLFRMGLLGIVFTAIANQPPAHACSDLRPCQTQPTAIGKINFDLAVISPDGLMGYADSLRSQAYELCIPDRPETLAEVKAIDPSLKFYRSRGRIGCREDQYLGIGETHQPHWRQILLDLANLDYIDRIDPFWGE